MPTVPFEPLFSSLDELQDRLNKSVRFKRFCDVRLKSRSEGQFFIPFG
jgi:hypothetical protein